MENYNENLSRHVAKDVIEYFEAKEILQEMEEILFANPVYDLTCGINGTIYDSAEDYIAELVFWALTDDAAIESGVPAYTVVMGACNPMQLNMYGIDTQVIIDTQQAIEGSIFTFKLQN